MLLQGLKLKKFKNPTGDEASAEPGPSAPAPPAHWPLPQIAVDRIRKLKAQIKKKKYRT